jgi:hypothetical protein
VGRVAVNVLQPYVLTIRRLAVLLVILADLVKVVLVELTHETGKVAMLEVFWQDGLGKFLALDCQAPC